MIKLKRRSDLIGKRRKYCVANRPLKFCYRIIVWAVELGNLPTTNEVVLVTYAFRSTNDPERTMDGTNIVLELFLVPAGSSGSAVYWEYPFDRIPRPTRGQRTDWPNAMHVLCRSTGLDVRTLGDQVRENAPSLMRMPK